MPGPSGSRTRWTVPGEGKKPAAGSFAVNVRLLQLSISEGRTRSEGRTHVYEVVQDIPNPEIPRLEVLIRTARERLIHLRREYDRHCRHCRGRGRMGRRKNANGPAGVVCRHCKGTGRASKVSQDDIRRAKRRLEALRHQLATEPAMVTLTTSAEWAYTVHTYEKTGVLSADVRCLSPAGGVIDRADIRKRYHAKDDAIDGANPAVGLRPDPLVLPSDRIVADSLIDAAAAEAAGRILSVTVDARVRLAESRAAALDKAGKPADALEARVDLVHLLRAHNPKVADALLKQLRAEPRP